MMRTYILLAACLQKFGAIELVIRALALLPTDLDLVIVFSVENYPQNY